MGIATILLAILYIIGCGLLVAIILMQKKRTAGFSSAFTGMGGSSHSNMGKSIDGSLEKFSKIGGALFFIVTIASWFIR